MEEHGFTNKQIWESLKKFDEDTKEAQKMYETLEKFNTAILEAKGDVPLAKICKGIFVGNILLKNANKQDHKYMMAYSDEFIIIVPFGPIQSIVHLMAIPKEPMYNAVSLSLKGLQLLRRMQAALKTVVADILTPDSKPQRLYLKFLSTAIDCKPDDTASIRITQERRKLDTQGMGGEEAIKQLRDDLRTYYEEKKKSGVSLDQSVCTDLHIHDTNTVGQLHVHGWVADSRLITDNGNKLKYKNTPVKRIIPVIVKHRGFNLLKSKISVIKKNCINE